MDPILIFGVIGLGLIAAYLFLFRGFKKPPAESGRPDRLERPEMTGNAQYQNRVEELHSEQKPKGSRGN